MDRKIIRQIIDENFIHFLSEEFQMHSVFKSGNQIFAGSEGEKTFAPILIFILTGNPYMFDLSAIFGLSSIYLGVKVGEDPKRLKREKINLVLISNDFELEGKGRRFSFRFNELDALLAYLTELKTLLLTEGRQFWNSYTSFENAEAYLNSQPLGNRQWTKNINTQAPYGLQLAFELQRPNLEILFRQYVALFETPISKSFCVHDSLDNFIAFGNKLLEVNN